MYDPSERDIRIITLTHIVRQKTFQYQTTAVAELLRQMKISIKSKSWKATTYCHVEAGTSGT